MEIERKFLVKTLPDLSGKAPLVYKRYFLYVGDEYEIRIQQKGEAYELERKGRKGDISNLKNSFPISSLEFEHLKSFCSSSLERESYNLDKDVSIKIYHGTYEKLIRAEFEFNSEDDAKSFIPPSWCNAEITATNLGRDSKLIHLTREEFEKELLSLQEQA